MADYNIFMTMIEKVGHDKRGNPTFKRDNEGNEILTPDVDVETGQERKVKQLDDETPDIPAVFIDWKHKEGIAW
jgi:type I restriction enzyme M protein